MTIEGKAAGVVLIGLGATGMRVGAPALLEKIQSADISFEEHPFAFSLHLWLEAGNELLVTGAGIAGIVAGLLQLFVSRKQ